MSEVGMRKRCVRWAFWFTLFIGCLAMGIGTVYLKTAGFPADLLAKSFLLISFPTHFISLAFLGFPFVVLISLLNPNRRLVVSAGILAGSVLLVLLLIDAGVYSLYRFHLNGMVRNLITSGVASEVLSLTWVNWATFSAIVAGLLLIQIIFAGFLWRHLDRFSFALPFFVLLLLLTLFSHLLHAWADYVQYRPITRIVRTLPAFKPVTMKRQLQKFGFKAPDRTAVMQMVDAGSSLVYPLEELQFTDSAKPLNVMLIVIDSWRYDMLTPETTPNIWRLAAKSCVYNQHYSNSHCTRFGIFSIFYGLYGTYWNAFLGEQRGPVLMNEFARRGYNTALFASAPLSNPEFDKTVFAGFKERLEIRQDGETALDRDLQITRKMKNFLLSRKPDRPFFGFLFYDAPHARQFPDEFAVFRPHLNSVNFLTLDKNTDPLPLLNTYKNALRFVDSSVAEIISLLESKGELENTVILITGDHGEEFNDLNLGYWGHNGNFAKYQTRTPLVIRFPDAPPRVYEHTTTSLDIVPTLMKDLFGCSTNPDRFSNGTYLTDNGQRPFIHLSSWDTFALVTSSKICVFENKGTTEIVDQNYRDLPGDRIDPQLSRWAIEGMSRFYGR